MTDPAPTGADRNATHRSTIQVTASRGFSGWLADQRISLALTTYESNKLLLVGLRPDGQLAVFERTFPRCMGLWSDGQTMWLTSQFEVWRLENVLAAGEVSDGCDRLFVPQVGYVTGDTDAHDIALGADGRPVLVNTLFSCLVTVSERYSFEPLWQPPFISRLAAEDRCHLNGLAMEDGRPRFVTACSRADVVDGWRDCRADGGCVIDVATGETVLEGLSMPHSPRLVDGQLWLLNSGHGWLSRLEIGTRRLEPVAFCPGYGRGLALRGNYAVVGLSKARETTFRGLPLDEELRRRGAEGRCGLLVVDLAHGDAVEWLRIEGSVAELYDVVILPDVRRPKALGFKTDEIRRTIWFPDQGAARRWTGSDRK